MTGNKKVLSMNQKNPLKKTSGFSLVEVIVAAVIVGILSAIAIPIYYGYITDAQQTTVNNLAETTAAAANAYWRKTGSDPTGDITPNSPPLNLYFSSPYTVHIDVNNVIVRDTKNNLSANRSYQ